MVPLQIGEVFGHDTAVSVRDEERKSKKCPFRDSPCTKQGKKNPLGICSYTDGKLATIVCPVRFLEGNRIFLDAARIAFGPGKECIAVPEVRVLEVTSGIKKRKIGKVDFLIVKVANGKAIDFAALEIQAVYATGDSIRPAFIHYLNSGELLESGKRRTDFRSSGPKRLMPQLSLKVPIFRRWGKRFFVVVDSKFFEELPTIREQSEGNSEVTWLAYPFERHKDGGYMMQPPLVTHTLWDDVEHALQEGKAPEKSAMLQFLTAKISGKLPFTT